MLPNRNKTVETKAYGKLPANQLRNLGLFDTKVISAWLLETYKPAGEVTPAFTGRPHGDNKWEDLEITAAIETPARNDCQSVPLWARCRRGRS